MKKNQILLGAAGLLALALTACSNEMPVNNDVAQKDEYRYMRVTISSPTAAGTRAGNSDFQAGTEAENAVNNMYFKFFDRNGNCVSNTTAEDVKFVDATEATGANNVGKVKEAVVKIALSEGAGMPAYVLCFINPFDWKDIESTDIPLNAFRTRLRQAFKQGEYFSMNNSVYFGDDAVSGATGVKISGTPIVYDQLFTTEEEAKNATGNSIVDIYVERYCSKVQFSLADAALAPTISVDGKTLTFNPEAWTINADAATIYAIKRYDNQITTNDAIPTLGQVNTMLTGWGGWNDAPNHRSYWSCTPGYYATNYPEVSDQIADYFLEKDPTNTGAGEVAMSEAGELVADAPNALKYYSFNQITNKALDSDGYGVTEMQATTGEDGATSVLPSKYVMENTVSRVALQSKNPKAATPSVVLVGNYVIEGVAPGTSFYIYDNHICYRDQAVADAQGAQTVLNAFLAKNAVLYVGSTTTTPEGQTSTTYAKLGLANANANIRAALSVKHPDKSVRGTVPVPHRNVTLQIENLGSINNLYYSPNGTDRYIQVTAANVDQVNSVLWNQLQSAEAYTNGKCYFSIPIKHLGWFERYPGDTNAPLTAQGGIDWPKVAVGDFGLVRNHVYNLNVTGITGRATGIENLDYPLVPAADIDSYFIKYKLNILNWRIVPTQTVTIN